MKITQIKPNPTNPRFIRDDKFRKLVESIRTFPRMMALRPIVVDADNVIQGGNMRFRALKELGYKDLPDEWVVRAEDLTAEEWRRFIVEDNVAFGEWDWDKLSAEYDLSELDDMALDVPNVDIETDEEDESKEDKEPSRFFVEVECKDAAHQTEMYERMIREGQAAKRIDR